MQSGADRLIDNIAELRRFVVKMQYCMLTTVVNDGATDERPLQTMDIDDDATLWFFTARSSEKIGQVDLDEHVGLTYPDPRARRFVFLSGTVRVVHDRQKAATLWRPTPRIFFPAGPDDPNLRLLKVEPSMAKIWDGRESILGVLLKLGKAIVSGEPSDPGTVGTVQLPHPNGIDTSA